MGCSHHFQYYQTSLSPLGTTFCELMVICLAVGWKTKGERFQTTLKSWVRYHWFSMYPHFLGFTGIYFLKRRYYWKEHSARSCASCWNIQIWPWPLGSSFPFGKEKAYVDHMIPGGYGDGGMCSVEPAKGTLLAWPGPGRMGNGQSQGQLSAWDHTES